MKSSDNSTFAKFQQNQFVFLATKKYKKLKNTIKKLHFPKKSFTLL